MYKIDLLHCEDINGSIGFIPKEVYIADRDRFNAFTELGGLFHDIFEHWFEGILPWASGNGMFTLWNEMVASGAAFSIKHITGVNPFRNRIIDNRSFTVDTIYLIIDYAHNHQESLDFDSSIYNLPSVNKRLQYPYLEYNIENIINEYIDTINNWEKSAIKRIRKAGITEKRIRNAYLLGACLVEDMFGVFKWDDFSVRDYVSEELENFIDILELNFCNNKNFYINDDYALPFKGFTTKVLNHSKGITIETSIFDDFYRNYPLEKLIT